MPDNRTDLESDQLTLSGGRGGAISPNRQIAIVFIAGLIIAAIFLGAPMVGHIFAAKPAPPPPEPPAGTFRATPRQWATLGFSTAALVPFRAVEETDGKIATDDDRTTQVFSPYTGRVIQVFAKVGDRVIKGAPLFAIDAAEFVQAQSDLLTAAAQVRLTQAAATRQKALFAASGAAQRDVEQSQSDLATANAALSAARNRLRVFGASPAQAQAVEAGLGRRGISPQAIVPSPIAGVVTQRSVGEGQNLGNISSNAPPAPAFTVSDLSTVWLVGNLREVDEASARIGQVAEVRVDALPGRLFTAKIDYIAPIIDPATRRVTVRAALLNADGALKPEMFATFTLVTGADRAAIGIPTEAVLREGDAARVWVARPGRLLMLREIKTGRTSRNFVEVLSGLSVGDEVVTNGALFIDRAARGD